MKATKYKATVRTGRTDQGNNSKGAVIGLWSMVGLWWVNKADNRNNLTSLQSPPSPPSTQRQVEATIVFLSMVRNSEMILS